MFLHSTRSHFKSVFSPSFLEASSYFSILPLVIHSSWKRFLSNCYPGASILGAEDRNAHSWGGGVVWGVAGRVAGGCWGRGRVVKYYYILSCTGSMFESGYF